MRNILCFGDSNTWGYNPENKERFPVNIRWTGKLQKKLESSDIHIIEQGLCGRTTAFEDISRPDRNGVIALDKFFEKADHIDSVILMLGTNDCKTYFGNSEKEIADGVSKCLDLILKYVAPEQVLLISPIQLGENVWKAEYDPEFGVNSVLVSKRLREEYRKIAQEKGVHFLAASDYANPSEADQEHLDINGHKELAKAIYKSVKRNWRCA